MEADDADSHDDEGTDDELGLIVVNAAKASTTRGGKGSSSKGSSRGSKAAPVSTVIDEEDNDKDDADDDDELAQPSAATTEKRPIGRSKTKQNTQKANAAGTKSTARSRAKETATEPKKEEAGERTTARKRTRGQTHSAANTAKPVAVTTGSSQATKSNMLRGPAKKKTVTFQTPDSEDEEEEEGDNNDNSSPERPATRQRRTTRQNTGLKASPARRPRATGPGSGRGRKPAATNAKEEPPKPLSPKKVKQVAKSVTSYPSSDGEDDELMATKNQNENRINLVESPAKNNSRNHLGMGSPVKKINFSMSNKGGRVSLEANNIEPGSESNGNGRTALGSPVRKINFNSNGLVQRNVDENGDNTIAATKQVDFRESSFISSPARKPAPPPFHYSFKETPRKCPLPAKDRLMSTSISQPDFTPKRSSPLKSSPRKADLGASFQGTPMKSSSTPFSSSRVLLFQSPAKKFPSPLKESVGSPAMEPRVPLADSTVDIFGERERLDSSEHGKAQVEEEPNTEGEGEEDEEDEAQDSINEEDALMADGVDDHGGPNSPEFHKNPEEDTNEMQPHLEIGGNSQENFDLGDDGEDDNITPSNNDRHIQPDVEEEEVQQSTDEDLAGSVERTGTDENELRMDPEAPEEEEVNVSPGRANIEDTDDVFVGVPVPLTQAVENSVQELDNNDDLGESHGVPNEEYDDDTSDNGDSVFDDDELTLVASSGNDVYMPTPRRVFREPAVPVNESGTTPLPGRFTLTRQASPYPPNNNTFGPSGAGNVGNCEEDGARILQDAEQVEADDFVNSLIHEDIPVHPGTSSEHRRTPSGERDTTKDQARPLHDDGDISLGPLPQQIGERRSKSLGNAQGERPQRNIFSLSGGLGRSRSVQRKPLRSSRGSLTSAANMKRSRPSKSPLRDITYAASTTSDQFGEANKQDSLHVQDADDDDDDVFKDLSRRISRRVSLRPSTGGNARNVEIYCDENDPPMAPQQDDSVAHYPILPLENSQYGDDDDDKENEKEKEDNVSVSVSVSLPAAAPSPAPAPATPANMKTGPSVHTLHTTSKIPLKPEAQEQVSPLKLPLKRRNSTLSFSPRRSSSRLQRNRDFSLPQMKMNSSKQTTFHAHPPPRKSIKLQQEDDVNSENRRRSKSSSKSMGMRRNEQRQSQSHLGNYEVAPKILQGATVFVDVHTTEGENASGIFIDLLIQMGAKCVKTWQWNPPFSVSSLSPDDADDEGQGKKNSSGASKVGITHVVYKDGGVRTLEKVRQAAGLVKCVGVGWVLEYALSILFVFALVL